MASHCPRSSCHISCIYGQWEPNQICKLAEITKNVHVFHLSGFVWLFYHWNYRKCMHVFISQALYGSSVTEIIQNVHAFSSRRLRLVVLSLKSLKMCACFWLFYQYLQKSTFHFKWNFHFVISDLISLVRSHVASLFTDEEQKQRVAQDNFSTHTVSIHTQYRTE